MDRFRGFPGYSATPGFLPRLRAYGGLMVVDDAGQRTGQTPPCRAERQARTGHGQAGHQRRQRVGVRERPVDIDLRCHVVSYPGNEHQQRQPGFCQA